MQEQSHAVGPDPNYETFIGYAEQENANSLDVTTALLGGRIEKESTEDDLVETAITSELSRIDADLDGRWRGAVYALDPQNPEAARHFCTSSREIITTILHLKAPDAEVLAQIPGCGTDQNGRPTRRSRINYCLERKGRTIGALKDFIEEDIKNVTKLFDILSAGTHGPTGKYDLTQLVSIKQRVEDAILFLAKVVD